jgi:hypothetical protein
MSAVTQDSFTSTTEVDAAMDGSWIEDETGLPGRRYTFAVDLGLVSDPSVVGVGSLEDGYIVINRLVTIEGSREKPVSLDGVARLLVDLAEAFPPAKILVESWQGIGVAQNLQRLGLPVTVTQPSPRTNAEQWSLLARALADRRLVLPTHPQLRSELLGLRYETTAVGVRVSGGAPHQDHAVTLGWSSPH